MSQPHDHEAGYKHRSTDKFLNYFKREVMDMCIHEGLHQINLLSPAETKIAQAEYMAQKSGQKNWKRLIKKSLLMDSSRLLLYSKHRSKISEMRLKNAPLFLKTLKNSNLIFWKNTEFL